MQFEQFKSSLNGAAPPAGKHYCRVLLPGVHRNGAR